MKTKGKVTGIISNIVIVKTEGPVAQNEIATVKLGEVRMMAEVIKVVGDDAYIQVFDSTRGLRMGAEVEFEGHMLEATLGPGILSKNYDGLQNDLADMDGLFIRRGQRTSPLNEETLWEFRPLAKPGDRVEAGDWLGEVKEQWIMHKIMVPFAFEGSYTVRSVAGAGEYNINHTVAVLEDAQGGEHPVTMVQKWPVKRPIKAYVSKPRPSRILETGVRPIDTFNPIADGGTGFIPGPFGAGKTVLQHAIAKQAEADIIIMIACGERANEVVEIFAEFPHLDDPHTGHKLMERTTIICNTSNMPVASREASVYTGMTIGEYYRAMGLKVLILADSTSRWAQALREMSNRLEELPGQDAFPMDLSAVISNFYARAGLVHLRNGATGSVTFLGTVSPAGGNLKEPVTEATQKAARCFYALSQQRADSKRYPAIDPLDSYSKYLEYPEIIEYLDERVEPGWVDLVNRGKTIVQRGKEASEQIDILGDDGVPVEYHDRFWKSELIDFVILQQDAFDAVDANTPLDRQRYMYNLVLDICDRKFGFDDFQSCVEFYKSLINLFKQLNYSEWESDKFAEYRARIDEMVAAKIDNITKATVTVRAQGVGNDELATVGGKLAQVVRISGDDITLQVFQGTEGIATDAEVVFHGEPPVLKVSDELAGRFFDAYGNPLDGGMPVEGEAREIGGPTVNPFKRIQPSELIATGIAGIDLNNTIVSGQKIPFFADPDQPYNQVMADVALRAQADKIILGGMGMTNDDYLYFKNLFENAGVLDRIVCFVNTTENPPVERLLVPDMALTAAEYFAVDKGEKVLVLLTDMTLYADALAIVSNRMDQIPSKDSMPGSLYSDLAKIYEKAVQLPNGGSITIIAVTTLSGGDITNAVPDNTGYITEGQLFLRKDSDTGKVIVDPFRSLSRLKQLVIGKKTREDHPQVMNAAVRLYSDAANAKTKLENGFDLSDYDERTLKFAKEYSEKLLAIDVNIEITEMLDTAWRLFAKYFTKSEVAIKEALTEKYWPRTA